MEQLYVKYNDGKPVAYAYGEEWVAMAMYMDDLGYPTEEEAKLAWISGAVDGVVRKETNTWYAKPWTAAPST